AGAAAGEEAASEREPGTAGVRLPRMPRAQAHERGHLGEGAQARLLPPAVAVSAQHAERAATREGTDRTTPEWGEGRARAHPRPEPGPARLGQLLPHRE